MRQHATMIKWYSSEFAGHWYQHTDPPSMDDGVLNNVCTCTEDVVYLAGADDQLYSAIHMHVCTALEEV